MCFSTRIIPYKYRNINSDNEPRDKLTTTRSKRCTRAIETRNCKYVTRIDEISRYTSVYIPATLYDQ